MARTVKVTVKMAPDFDKIVRSMPGVGDAVTEEASYISGKANALGAGFRTGLYHRDHQSPAVGNTAPEYAYEKAKASTRYGFVASVHPANYAAMKDNHMHNTLLKAKG